MEWNGVTTLFVNELANVPAVYALSPMILLPAISNWLSESIVGTESKTCHLCFGYLRSLLRFFAPALC